MEQANAQLQSIRHLEQGDCSIEADALDRAHAASLFAHEVNNLMTQIRGRAQLAMIHPDNPKLVQGALETADRAGSQIAQLAEAFLADQAPAASGGSQAALVSLGTIHDQVLGFIDDADRQAFGFDLHSQSDNLPATRSPGAVHQILLNLYLNAVHAIKAHRSPTLFVTDAAKTGSIQVHIETQAECSTGNNFGSGSGSVFGSGSESQPSPMIRIRVEDTGVGMDEHQLARILHPQRRGSDPGQRLPTTKPHGHGLGLRVCHELIAQINGRLSAHSTPGVGTTMIVDIPCSDDAQNNSRAAA
tara:strand:+ start:82638 stop:83543 length:906 start_codon:yes stop_codon:yes gene_type:complete